MKIFVISVFIIISFTSCFSKIAKTLGVKAKVPIITELKRPSNHVLFLGMSHMGKKIFYDNTKKIIDSLKNDGYTFFVESVSNRVGDSIVTDTTYAKKLRKIIGLDITISYDQINNVIWKMFRRKYKLIGQPSYKELGIDTFNIVDVPYNTLINSYETKYGAIILDSCDINTKLGEPYNCNFAPKSNRMIFEDEYVKKMRNTLISNTVKNSKAKKIVLIYGKYHLDGIREQLEGN